MITTKDTIVAINSFLYVATHYAQNIFRKMQSEGLTKQYQTDAEFLLKFKMLPNLAFLSEHDVVEYFMIEMNEFPQSTLKVTDILRALIYNSKTSNWGSFWDC